MGILHGVSFPRMLKIYNFVPIIHFNRVCSFENKKYIQIFNRIIRAIIIIKHNTGAVGCAHFTAANILPATNKVPRGEFINRLLKLVPEDARERERKGFIHDLYFVCVCNRYLIRLLITVNYLGRLIRNGAFHFRGGLPI